MQLTFIERELWLLILPSWPLLISRLHFSWSNTCVRCTDKPWRLRKSSSKRNPTPNGHLALVHRLSEMIQRLIIFSVLSGIWTALFALLDMVSVSYIIIWAFLVLKSFFSILAFQILRCTFCSTYLFARYTAIPSLRASTRGVMGLPHRSKNCPPSKLHRDRSLYQWRGDAIANLVTTEKAFVFVIQT